MIITIDGLVASGKGMLAKLLAQHYDCDFLPTGNLYRVAAKILIDNKINIDSFIKHPKQEFLELIEAQLPKEDIFSPNLALELFSQSSSKIGTVAELRYILNAFQREWAAIRSSAIVEGRDSGTVVFPDAEVKLFLIADPKVRADRRMKDLQALNQNVTREEVLNSLLTRDQLDQTRRNDPLKQAPDAVLLDTTHLSIDETLATAIEIIEKKIDNLQQKV